MSNSNDDIKIRKYSDRIVVFNMRNAQKLILKDEDLLKSSEDEIIKTINQRKLFTMNERR